MEKYVNDVSVLIFSMNKVDNVVRLSKKLKNFVDDIVIVDSSRLKSFNILRRKIPFARVYWVPPIGCVELLYKIGIKLTKNNWVLHLEDDEEPNEDLLINLKRIINSEDSKVYRVRRIDTRLKTEQMIIRLFDKKYVVPTGCIHWCWGSKVGFKDLDKKYIIYHNTDDLSSFRKRVKRLWNFSVVESYQWGYKIYSTINSKYIKYEDAGKNIKKIARILFNFQVKLGKIGWYLLATEYNLYWLLYGLLKVRKVPFESFLYWLFIQINLSKDFNKKLKIWQKMIEIGDPIDYLDLDDLGKIANVSWMLREDSGLANLKKLMERKLS